MENAQLIALSRQVALQRQMDVVANNMANLNTTGFKGESLQFEDYLMPVDAGVDFGWGDELLHYTQDWGTTHDLTPGAIAQTGNPLDVALQGEGYLTILTPAGERYTRNGALTLNNAGELVTQDGYQVAGDGGPIDRALKRLRANGHVYEKDGATWFRATEFGDEKDRVVIRANGQKTYFASDIAYHLDKRERGFDLLLTILGADHHGYVARVRAGLAAMGEPPESLEVPMMQFVTLWKGGEKVAMGKREAQFVTLRELRAEVGNDATRFIYVMRSNDQALDFDLELAKKQSNDNPVYYVQYAHARIASVLKQAAERGLPFDRAAGIAGLAELSGPAEIALMREVSRWPEVLHLGAEQRAPHLVVHYLRELAQAFHACYAALPFIVDDARARNARLALIAAARQVLANALGLLGVSAPESM